MLGLLDLRERGERLEPSRFEDRTVRETVRLVGHGAAMAARKERA